MNAKTWLVLGACLGGLAVGLGAFGAHGLPGYYESLELPSASELPRKGPENWETAARYHMYHALAMLGIGLLADRRRLWLLDAAGVAFFFGILLFSGCLYAWALTGTKTLIHLVPVGGVLYLVGWILLALAGNYFAAPVICRPPTDSSEPTPASEGDGAQAQAGETAPDPAEREAST